MGAAGFRATPSVLIVPLQNEFGWNRAVISIAVSINLILFGLTGPFAAALMDRFGLRVVTVGALTTVATGALLTTVMNAPWQLYLLWGVVVGLGTGCMASVLAATVANRWFVHRRGLVLGALTAAGVRGEAGPLRGEEERGPAAERPIELAVATGRDAEKDHLAHAVGKLLRVREAQGAAPRAAYHEPAFDPEVPAQPLHVRDQRSRVVGGEVRGRI